MRNKDSETLYPVSMALCVKSAPWTNYPSLFPLPFFTQNERQTKTQQQLACLVLLCESAASLSTLTSSSAHKSPALTIHYLPDSMLLFLLSFYLISPFLYLCKNKALLMTMGSQGPAGAGYSKVRRSGKGGTSSFSSSSFITGENRGSRGVNVLLLHRGLDYHHGSRHVKYQGAFPSS